MNLKITAIYPGLIIHLNNIHFRCRAERIVLSVMITDLNTLATLDVNVVLSSLGTRMVYQLHQRLSSRHQLGVHPDSGQF